MNNFKILFHFESEVFSLIEIKRLLSNEVDKSKLFFWLLFDKHGEKLQKLNFVSMSSDVENEFWVFEHEQLTFNKQKAVLILDNKEFQLEAIPTEADLNIDLKTAINDFLDITI